MYIGLDSLGAAALRDISGVTFDLRAARWTCLDFDFASTRASSPPSAACPSRHSFPLFSASLAGLSQASQISHNGSLVCQSALALALFRSLAPSPAALSLGPPSVALHQPQARSDAFARASTASNDAPAPHVRPLRRLRLLCIALSASPSSAADPPRALAALRPGARTRNGRSEVGGDAAADALRAGGEAGGGAEGNRGGKSEGSGRALKSDKEVGRGAGTDGVR